MGVRMTIDLSDELYTTLSSYGFSKEKITRESKKLLALKFYKDKILSLGKATELAGLSQWEFIDYLGENNVPVMDYNDVQIAAEFESVNELKEGLKNEGCM